MKIFDLSLMLNGFKIQKSVQAFDALSALKGEALLAYQKERRDSIFSYHLRHNPFYRKILDDHGFTQFSPDSWHRIPAIRKADLQGNLEYRMAVPYRNQKVFRNNTSGSSGTPFYFAKNLWCHAMTWASYKHRFGQHGIDFNSSLQARFYGIPLTGAKYYREKLKDWLSCRVRFPVFNLDDETCAAYLKKFERNRFVYLNGYTSSLVLFAKFCINRGIVLKNICPSLTTCFTTSEMCGESDRNFMEQGFGVKVVNEYGAAELDLLAVEDADGQWVLNEETVYIEVVDEIGEPVADGTPGKILVTALYNEAFPLIRYELGDMGTISNTRNASGRRILQSLEGRTNDIAVLPSGRKVPGLTFYYVTKKLLESGSDIREFVIRQEEPDRFVLEYVASGPIGTSEQEAIQKLMDTYLEPGLKIGFELVVSINRTRMGKLRQFQNNHKPQ